jgi:hypothetical protein
MKQLIPIAYLNEQCFLSVNTDDKKYKMAIAMSEDDLKDILGRSFFEQIQTQYDSDSFTTANDTLYEDYIKKYLAWQSFFNYTKFANVEATPTGIRQFIDENSTVADDIKMYSLEKNILERANKYKYDLVNFLKESRANDSTAYPLWNDGCRDYMSFAITAIDGCNNEIIKVNKAINTNE